MSTKDKTTAAITMPGAGLGKVFVLHNYVDFTVTANQIGNTETMDIFDIPANHLLLWFGMKVATADAQINDVDVGIVGGASTDLVEAADISSTGWKTDADEAYSIAASAGFISTSNAVVVFTNQTAATLNDAKIHFYAVVADLSDAATNI